VFPLPLRQRLSPLFRGDLLLLIILVFVGVSRESFSDPFPGSQPQFMVRTQHEPFFGKRFFLPLFLRDPGAE